jgi:carbon-monoxide dehydrogenase medium subunit
MLAMRLTHFENLIDISRIDELIGIELRGDDLWIGAATADALVGMDDEVAESVPLLSLSTPFVGHFQIRTRGTLGGSIAHADPAAEYPAVALALDARMEVVSRTGRREIAAADFFTGLWETSLAGDEMLVGVRFPVRQGRRGFAVEEFARRHGDFAIAGAAVAVELDVDDTVTRCGIGLMGLGSTPLRASAAEEAVVGRPAREVTAEDIGMLAMTGLDDIPTDLQGSAHYRKRVGATMVARAWTRALSDVAAEALDA